jgi:5'-methylthioadenosine phosphorylase
MTQVKLGLIGGSGLGALLGDNQGQRHEVTTPFGRPSDTIIETQWQGLPVLLLSRHGPGHVLNPTQVPYRANICALKQLGCTHLIASGAVGSLREEFAPRHLVIPDQLIDKTYGRASTFFTEAAVHVEMAEPFCPVLRQILLEAATASAAQGQEPAASGQPNGTRPGHLEQEPAGAQPSGPAPTPPPGLVVHGRGCYVCMEGPAFSTRAESLMHRLWGGDLIGMTAMPEAKLAREAQISYALVAMVTDYDCWRAPPADAAGQHDKAQVLQEIIANLQAASANAMKLIAAAARLLAAKGQDLPPSPAHRALELGIWSDKSYIPAQQVQRLAPLWMEYFRA